MPGQIYPFHRANLLRRRPSGADYLDFFLLRCRGLFSIYPLLPGETFFLPHQFRFLRFSKRESVLAFSHLDFQLWCLKLHKQRLQYYLSSLLNIWYSFRFLLQMVCRPQKLSTFLPFLFVFFSLFWILFVLRHLGNPSFYRLTFFLCPLGSYQLRHPRLNSLVHLL